MKKLQPILLLLLVSLGFSKQVLAQQEKGSQAISAGLGFVSTEMWQDATDDLGRAVVAIGTFGNFNAGVTNRKYTSTFHIACSRALTDKISLGLTGAYEKATGDYQQNNEIVGHFRRQSFTIASEGKFLYLNRKMVNLYGVLGFGYTFNNQRTNKPDDWVEFYPTKSHFNFQLSPIGIRVGEDLGGFLELGFGYKGCLNSGLSYRF